MFSNIGPGEIILIIVVLLILFGAKKIPELAQGIGKGMKEFRKAVKDVDEEVKTDIKSIDNSKKEEEKKS
jgi:sec-independent protein translocase protein TatA